MAVTDAGWRSRLREGLVIPALPLALNRQRKWDERRQRALLRYYQGAGAGGFAAGVHTTQFSIRQKGLFRPVLEAALSERRPNVVAIAGVCGKSRQAREEAELAATLGFNAILLSLGAWKESSEKEILVHCRELAKIRPLFGFYLQPSVGGRLLSHRFWRRFAEIENVAAIKIAPFNRYQTIDVIRAVAESGRSDIALYTGNDDQILLDLLTPFHFQVEGKMVERRVVGGLLGQWAVWTRRAVEMHAECRRLVKSRAAIPSELLARAVELTDANAALFDAANGFAGCIPGLHEILRRQGLLEGTWCLDPREVLSPGQRQEISRVCRAYPHLSDDEFVAENIGRWLR